LYLKFIEVLRTKATLPPTDILTADSSEPLKLSQRASLWSTGFEIVSSGKFEYITTTAGTDHNDATTCFDKAG
jgi:hypothetical protein